MTRKRKMSEAAGLVGARSGQLPLDGREYDESVPIVEKADDDAFLSAYQKPYEPKKRRRVNLDGKCNEMMKRGMPFMQADDGGLGVRSDNDRRIFEVFAQNFSRMSHVWTQLLAESSIFFRVRATLKAISRTW